MAGGNWMPELIEAAGGHNLFGAAGKHSDWMQWDELGRRRSRGDRRRALRLRPRALPARNCRCCRPSPAGPSIAAVRDGRVYFADGNAYFNRPGPRLADSAEMLAEMLHPEVAEPVHKGTAWVAPVR